MYDNLDYQDVILLPNKKMCTITSRSDLSTKVMFLGKKYELPVLPANMACTIDFNLASILDKNNYFYILHRYYPEYGYEIPLWLRSTPNYNNVSISIGVKDKDKELLDYIIKYKFNINNITIDVAHGHHILVKEMCEYIRSFDHFEHTNIIAGNVNSVEACYDYNEWNIDAIKVGLSRGKACSTYGKTGVGSCMFSTIKKCVLATNLPIIADGGIRTIGDIAKALVAGATMVMIGSLFCECQDSPANTLNINKINYKEYYGSASIKNKKCNRYIEGETILLEQKPYNYLDLLSQIKQGLQSTMSYNNCTDIKELKNMNYIGLK